MTDTVLFLGAGATKAAQGLLTDEILPALLLAKTSLQAQDPNGRVDALIEFLEQEFHVNASTRKEDYPGLPLLMSLIDTALDRREAFHDRWDSNAMAQLREAIEFGIFDVLEDSLRKAPTSNHYTLFRKLFPGQDCQPCVITTNYDLIADSAMMNVSKGTQGGLPNYHCGIANISQIGPEQRFGTLLKLHGSLNWLLCKTCLRLELGQTESIRYLAILQQIVAHDLKSTFQADGAPCAVCQSKLRPLLVAPSHLKDYRNPHLAQVWYEAQRVMRQAKRVIFIGYSMPDDDVEVVYLVKRGLAHIKDPKQITVVEYCRENPSIAARDHPVGRRYQSLFGGIDWRADGLDQWLNTVP
ncbi:SIR2 family protein [Tunturiibacter gelidoferens]|uniref:NAD-dependent SIR2 family protein deacetylase n=1 Tax=Tunturiibacter gelidiferens TaxID=3069689 RepID=A0ACC5P3M8_9BACT|nr:SIR2 family protein [Edaphobacter lichenicola]MBB5341459.1 NAD-dependent SIR2 family protein deacetylase [Edaphobacter lichenicola]